MISNNKTDEDSSNENPDESKASNLHTEHHQGQFIHRWSHLTAEQITRNTTNNSHKRDPNNYDQVINYILLSYYPGFSWMSESYPTELHPDPQPWLYR